MFSDFNSVFRSYLHLFIGYFFINKLFYVDEEFIISLSFFFVFFNLFFSVSDIVKNFLDKISFDIYNVYIGYYTLFLKFISSLKVFHRIRNRKEFLLSLINFYIGFFFFYMNLIKNLFLSDRLVNLDGVLGNFFIKVYRNEISENRLLLEKFLSNNDNYFIDEEEFKFNEVDDSENNDLVEEIYGEDYDSFEDYSYDFIENLDNLSSEDIDIFNIEKEYVSFEDEDYDLSTDNYKNK